MTSLKKQAHDERGATAVEYVLLLAFIAVSVVVGIAVFGGAVLAFWENVIQPGVVAGL